MPPGLPKIPRSPLAWLSGSLLLIWCVGMFGRAYWTPDEPREADIVWRMSGQSDKAVPLLAGEPFCEKPPLTYWVAALPVKVFGPQAWAARLPNLAYALIAALGVGMLATRCAGRLAGWAGAAAFSTFLLSYQVAIWLATDAPLLAAVSVALLGTYIGFYAESSRERVRGYLLMHAALGLGFLCKSAAAWMVPALTLLTLSLWERRWRELIRWELYLGVPLQAALILSWVWFVYSGVDGPAHLKVFFWNNLVGRFTAVDAPAQLQYAAAHRNSPGKYLIELPLYLFPWTFLTIAALRRAWRHRRSNFDNRAVRFGLAASLPPLLVLSLAATARNIYFAPALPGIALLLAWWAWEILPGPDRWDVRALRATAALLLAAAAIFCAALTVLAVADRGTLVDPAATVLVSTAGVAAAVLLAVRAWGAAPTHALRAQYSLLLAYCALLVGPASQVYRQVDRWQDLAGIGSRIAADAAGKPLILLAPDETTRAFIDMYVRTSVLDIPGPLALETAALQTQAAAAPESRFLVQWRGADRGLRQWLERSAEPGRDELPTEWQPWMRAAQLEAVGIYSVPHGRRYVLLRTHP